MLFIHLVTLSCDTVVSCVLVLVLNRAAGFSIPEASVGDTGSANHGCEEQQGFGEPTESS